MANHFPGFTVNPADPNDTDPESNLLGILRRIGDVQNQPLVPENPLAQLGAALSGFSSGVRGAQNPALEFYLQRQKNQLGALSSQADVAKATGDFAGRRDTRTLAAAKEEREERQRKIANYSQFAREGLGSSDPNYRALGGKMAGAALELAGAPLSPAEISGLSSVSFDATKIADALKMRAMGMPDDVILNAKGLSPDVWASSVRAAGSDDARKVIGLPTKAEIEKDALDLQGKVLDNIQKQISIKTPEFAKDVFTFLLANGKNPLTSTDADFKQAAQDKIAHDINKQLAGVQAQPVSGELLASYTGVSTAIDQLELIGKITTDPAMAPVIKAYMGTAGWRGLRETGGRALGEAGLMRRVPQPVLDIGYAEDRGKNAIIKSLTGANAPVSELPRLEKEWPNRSQDSLREYEVKRTWALNAAKVVQKRLEILGSANGRKALEQGIDVYAKFAAQVHAGNPLPPAVDVPGAPAATLPPGFKMVK